jgi:hypothetical protein
MGVLLSDIQPDGTRSQVPSAGGLGDEGLIFSSSALPVYGLSPDGPRRCAAVPEMLKRSIAD